MNLTKLTVALFFFAALLCHGESAKPNASTKPASNGPTVETVTLNQILFSETEQSWTLRDLQLYQKILNVAYNKKKLSEWTENISEDFVLSRLSYREALLFGVSPEKIKLSEGDRNQFSKYTSKEIDEELNRLSYSLMFIELKANQLKQKERFKPWLDHLKRKYQVKFKATEVIQ